MPMKIYDHVYTILTDDQFRSMLDLYMVSDPEPDGVDFEPLLALIEKESLSRGYESWVEAFHYHMKKGGER